MFKKKRREKDDEGAIDEGVGRKDRTSLSLPKKDTTEWGRMSGKGVVKKMKKRKKNWRAKCDV